MGDAEDNCAICYETLEGGEQTYLLECEHKFHVSCIMKWFRNKKSNCPLCNDTQEYNNLCRYERIECIKLLKQMTRRKNCPPRLKTINQTIKKTTEDLKNIKKEAKQFRKDNKTVLLKARSFYSKQWKTSRKIRKLEDKMHAYAQLNPIYLSRN